MIIKYRCKQYDEKIDMCTPNWVERNFNKKCPITSIIYKIADNKNRNEIDPCSEGIVEIDWIDYIKYNKELDQQEDLVKL